MTDAPDPQQFAADRAVVEQLAEVWGRLAELGATLGPDDWRRPTDVPGWSVQDHVAHLADIEARLLGRPAPEHTVPTDLAHVRNDAGAANEVFVDARRSWTGADVLAEFVEVTDERLAGLRALGPDGFAAESWTPMGAGTVRDLLPFRAFDSWVHEQDVRRALGRPGGLTGPAAEATVERCLGTLGFTVGKRAGAPDGASVVLTTTAPLARTVVVTVADGRARLGGDRPADPTVGITIPGEAYVMVACGRGDVDALLADGTVTIEGDRELGERIVRSLNFLF